MVQLIAEVPVTVEPMEVRLPTACALLVPPPKLLVNPDIPQPALPPVPPPRPAPKMAKPPTVWVYDPVVNADTEAELIAIPTEGVVETNKASSTE